MGRKEGDEGGEEGGEKGEDGGEEDHGGCLRFRKYWFRKLLQMVTRKKRKEERNEMTPIYIVEDPTKVDYGNDNSHIPRTKGIWSSIWSTS